MVFPTQDEALTPFRFVLEPSLLHGMTASEVPEAEFEPEIYKP